MQIPNDIYEKILEIMPIPCVDLLVENESGELLLVHRANEPAMGQWWLPGGRVHFAELREAAARRKLLEECGLEGENFKEVKTVDLILPRLSGGYTHGITTIFAAKVAPGSIVKLDEQSHQFCWKKRSSWKNELLHPFVADCIALLEAGGSNAGFADS
jgi:colanic acid biosynthesis protein WcaH